MSIPQTPTLIQYSIDALNAKTIGVLILIDIVTGTLILSERFTRPAKLVDQDCHMAQLLLVTLDQFRR